MKQDKIVLKVQRYIGASAEEVWSYLDDPQRLPTLFTSSARAAWERGDGAVAEGTMSLGRLSFRLRLCPFDLSLCSEPCVIVLRLTPEEEGCVAAMAARYSPSSGFSVLQSDLENVLSRLEQAVCGPPEEQKSRPVKPEGAAKKNAAGRGGWKKAAIAAGVVVAAAALVFGGVRLAASKRELPPAENAEDLSLAVTYENALALSPGQSRAEIERALGTQGVARGRDEVVYRSSDLGLYGVPRELVLVAYENGAAASITYLNTAASGDYTAAAGRSVSEAGGAPEELSAQIGLPVSMLRRYTLGGDQMQEIHFGFCDPFANFDPAWRGEIAVTQNQTQGTASVGYWGGYDGADPLMVGRLEEGTPLAGQYDSYTEFLHDKYQYDRALSLLGRWSMGDMLRWYPELEAYESGSGATAYRAFYASPVGDGAQPRYTVSYLLNNANGFMMGSFANLALYEREDTLTGTRAASVTRNMSYGEVRTLLGILPTALFVDENGYYVCYGRYLGGAEIEEQFALVIRFDPDTDLSEQVYANAAINTAGQETKE